MILAVPIQSSKIEEHGIICTISGNKQKFSMSLPKMLDSR